MFTEFAMGMIGISLVASITLYTALSSRLKSDVENERGEILKEVSEYLSEGLQELSTKYGNSLPPKEVWEDFYKKLFDKQTRAFDRLIPIKEPLGWLKHAGASFIIDTIVFLISIFLDFAQFQVYSYIVIVFGATIFIYACIRVYQIVTYVF